MLSIEEKKIKELETKIGLLGQTLTTQQKLINVLKSMPGNTGRNLEGVEQQGSKRVLIRAKAKSSATVEDAPKGEPRTDGKDVGSKFKDTSAVEHKLQ